MRAEPLQEVSDYKKEKEAKAKIKGKMRYFTTDGKFHAVWRDAVEHQMELDEKEEGGK